MQPTAIALDHSPDLSPDLSLHPAAIGNHGLELGGKSPQVVSADADLAATTV